MDNHGSPATVMKFPRLFSAAFSSGLLPFRSSRCFLRHCGLPARNAAAVAALAGLMGGAAPAGAQVRLNEFMASNGSTVVPGAVAGTFEDWIELRNESATEAADLGGWHLTDNAANPAKWTFPAGVSIAPGGYLVVFASSTGARDANGNWHTSFALSAGGEYLGLFRPDGSLADEFEAGGAPFPPQERDVSYGRRASDGAPVYFATPTPGAANAATGAPRVAAVAVSAARGFYATPVTVALSVATPEAAIYYTRDGSPPLQANGTPASSAEAYAAPVEISTTTVLRAAAVRSGYDPAPAVTHTYVFPQAVATQTRPAGYPTAWGSEPSADYNVDPAVSQSAVDGARFQEGLRALPTLSVSTTMASLFGTSGIYSQPLNETLEAVVSAEYFQPAAEGAGVNSDEGFQVECAMQIQGGASRNPNSAIKHSFSLRFRADVGQGKLEHPLFGEGAVESFNNVQLRAMYNNSWIHSNAEQRARATMIPDQWMRDSMLEMGQADALRGHFVHLYLNGLYWGVYNLHERPNGDHYAGYNNPALDADSIISYNPGGFTSAEQASFNSLRTTVNAGNWEAIEQKLDVDSYIDYYIMQQFGRNDDLKTDGNWRATGGGAANARWRFYLWDSERVLENRASTGNLAISQDGAELINGLDHLPEFQARFADRAWKHLAHGGALTNARNRARYEARVRELDAAITGESARWGDDRTGGGGPSGDYTRQENWLRAIYGPLSVQPTGGVLGATGWFPENDAATNRTSLMLAAWKTQRWTGTTVTKLPAIDPPEFTVNGAPQHGGLIPEGGVLGLTGGTGTLYVTTDGSDPRQPGGAVQPGLAAYVAEGAVALAESGWVRARWFDGTRWSALNEAFFSLEPQAGPGEVRIVEINYHPAEPSASEQAAGAALTPPRHFIDDDFQFIELLNSSSQPVNLRGAAMMEGVAVVFDNIRLAAGQRAVAVKDPVAFAIRYGTAIKPAGVFSGSLAHSGETLTLKSAAGAALSSVAYSDSGAWPSRADGDGSSLEMTSLSAPPADASSWRASVEFHGSPGAAGAGSDGRVLINEVLASPGGQGRSDSIELVNATETAIDLSGWFLSDSRSVHRSFRIPQETILAPGGYVVFDEADFNASTPAHPITALAGTAPLAPVTVTSPAHGLATDDVVTISGYGGFGAYNGSFQATVLTPDTFSIPAVFLDAHETRGSWVAGRPFALSAAGETLSLLSTTAEGKLYRFMDSVDIPASTESGRSFGRWPNAQGPLTLMGALTLGAANSGPDAPPSGFSAWLAGHGLAEEDAGIDSDDDGLANLAEYAFGLHPRQPDSSLIPPAVAEDGTLRFSFRRAAARADVTVIVEASESLDGWTPLDSALVSTDAEGIESRLAEMPMDGPRRFVRCRVVRAP